MGMLFPHGGSVRVFGLSPTTAPVGVKKRVGYVAEDQVLPPGSSIDELIALHRYLFPRWDSGLECELLSRFTLDPAARVKSLSKGQARQVALLCAVCQRPELLILDEPAGDLDPAARREFLETSIQLLNRKGSSILFSSHHMSDVERIGRRVVLLDNGRVRLDRNLDRLREDVCVAMLPLGSAPDTATLRRIPGCLNARPVFNDWHAIFEGAPETVQRQINETLGVNGTRCVRVPWKNSSSKWWEENARRSGNDSAIDEARRCMADASLAVWRGRAGGCVRSSERFESGDRRHHIPGIPGLLCKSVAPSAGNFF
jgi:ABC-type uncharacterized transport system ATPase subunit